MHFQKIVNYHLRDYIYRLHESLESLHASNPGVMLSEVMFVIPSGEQQHQFSIYWSIDIKINGSKREDKQKSTVGQIMKIRYASLH